MYKTDCYILFSFKHTFIFLSKEKQFPIKFAFSIWAGQIQNSLRPGCLFMFLFTICAWQHQSDRNHMPRALKLWWKGALDRRASLNGLGRGALQVVDLCPFLRTELGRGSAMCATGSRAGWWKQLCPAEEGQKHPKHLRGAGSCLAASAASWIVCCWKGDHQSSVCLWNLLHGISFTLARKSSPEKDQENTFSLIKACCQKPSVGWCLIQWYRRRKQFYEVWLLTIFIIWVDFLW